MNILFFLTPKSEVAYIPADESLRQAFEKLKYHGYSAVPTLTDEGKYAERLQKVMYCALWNLCAIGIYQKLRKSNLWM